MYYKLRIDDTKCAIKHKTNKSVTQQNTSWRWWWSWSWRCKKKTKGNAAIELYSYYSRTKSKVFLQFQEVQSNTEERTGVFCWVVSVHRFRWLDDYGNVVLGIFLDDVFNFMTLFPWNNFCKSFVGVHFFLLGLWLLHYLTVCFSHSASLSLFLSLPHIVHSLNQMCIIYNFICSWEQKYQTTTALFTFEYISRPK